MEQPQYLIDTNAVIDYLGKRLPPSGQEFMNLVIDSIPNVSVITRIEVLGFNAPDEYYQFLKSFMDDSIIFHLTDRIVEETISIRKKHKIKLPDAIIAATAIVYDLVLISSNTADFKNIQGLHPVNAYL